ncbi:hypothetical protein TNCV_61081 [Trichonephila clavipes]|nr:hypothetical protein TNCV_61081 [Trichonephila clavipes]
MPAIIRYLDHWANSAPATAGVNCSWFHLIRKIPKRLIERNVRRAQNPPCDVEIERMGYGDSYAPASAVSMVRGPQATGALTCVH